MDPQQEISDKNGADKQKKQDRKLKVWDKTSHSQPRQAMPGDFYYSAAKSLNEINCTSHTIRPLQKIYYGSDGSEIKSIRHDEAKKPDPVVPDTPAEAVFDFACTFKPSKSAVPAPRAKPKATPQQPADKPVRNKGKSGSEKAAKTANSSTPPPGEP